MTQVQKSPKLDALFNKWVTDKHDVFKDILAPMLRPAFEQGFANGFAEGFAEGIRSRGEDKNPTEPERCSRCVRLLHRVVGVDNIDEYCLGHHS